MVPAARTLCVFLHACLMWSVSRAEASFCTSDQIAKCKNAAIGGSLDSLPQGGECKPSTYVKYTHLCSVTNYLPVPDYCCCAFEHNVFCCRYHYDGNYFRCDEDEDVIYVLPSQPITLEILIPSIVVPSVALLCFIFYCIKCCCCNDDDDDDDENQTCSIFTRCRRRRRRRRRREKCPTARVSGQYAVAHDSQSSNLLPPSQSISNMDKPLEKCDKIMDMKYPAHGSDRSEPSAPPYDLNRMWNPPPYNPDLYDPVVVANHAPVVSRDMDAGPPFIHYKNEHGQNVIYQPVLTHAQIPLPQTKLTDNVQQDKPVTETDALQTESDDR